MGSWSEYLQVAWVNVYVYNTQLYDARFEGNLCPSIFNIEGE